jgi:hypothetical protein
MRKTIFALTVAAAAIVAVAGDVRAADTRTLSEFLASCSAKYRECRGLLGDYIEAASTQELICLPKDLSTEDAVDRELDWLRHTGASDDKLFRGNVEDAEWAAASALWPCKTE